MNIIQQIKSILTGQCQYVNECKHYQKGSFNCENQETAAATTCGIWREWV